MQQQNHSHVIKKSYRYSQFNISLRKVILFLVIYERPEFVEELKTTKPLHVTLQLRVNVLKCM